MTGRGPARVAAVAAALVIAGGARGALAHQSAVKYLDVAIDGASARLELRFQPADVTRPLGLADDATPDPDAALAGAGAVVAFVAPWVALRAGDAACPATAAPALGRATADPRFLALAWTVRCPGPIERVVLDLGGFFSVDRTHEMVLHLTAPETPAYATTIAVGDSPLALALGDAAPGDALAWLTRGFAQAFAGPLGVGIVLALVAVAAIARPRPRGAWIARPPRAVAWRAGAPLAALVAGQTAAVLAADAGALDLPGGFSAAMGALALGYLAIEDALAPATRWRPATAGAFGAVLGAGLGGAYLDLAPPDAGTTAALAFALGAAAAELAVAALATPTFAVLARVVGAARYRRVHLPAVGAVLAVLAAGWFALGR